MQLEHLTPILNVSNIEQSIVWFAKFGWKQGFIWKPTGEATFGSVCCGDIEIFLCRNGQGGREGDGHGAWMSLWVNDVDASYADCKTAGLEVIRPPQNEPWNVREMHVRHPDGHIFRVSRAVDCD
ncbi:MAG: bleomycin resistance family protein [Planctomycetaceae bacterium]